MAAPPQESVTKQIAYPELSTIYLFLAGMADLKLYFSNPSGYIKNLDTDNTGNVSGMLLYAKTDELVLPNNNYKMGGNAISVKTLDLDCDFSEIRRQLDEIVYSCFEFE